MSLDADLTLLRRFEPLLRHTRGEHFFPMNVEHYVVESSLWCQHPYRPPHCLIPQGELTLERLGEPREDEFGAVHFLKFIDPVAITELPTYTREQIRNDVESDNVFHAGQGRLARVGYSSRLVDALFSLSLLARGRVPGDTAVAATRAYQQSHGEREHYSYYGRITHENGWVVLQYWFFYAFNHWRSGFFGANDHEADWEMITLYLCEAPDGVLRPEWVAYASHDFSGDDLRRHWEDPEVEKVDEHPVVYVGAGSHASYFSRGEYLTELELPFLAPLARALDRQQKFWQRVLRQYGDEEGAPLTKPHMNIFRVPFVDYARGDGLSIGPGQAKQWNEVHLLDPVPDWALNYRGLWGLYARDPFSGEDAPAGPLYNRDGSARRAWYDPLGWAGVDKLPTRKQAVARAEAQRAIIAGRQATNVDDIEAKNAELMGLTIEAEAMLGHPHLQKLHASHEERIDLLAEALGSLRAQVAADAALLRALDEHIAELQVGKRGSLRAHIRRAHAPTSDDELRLGRFAETWSAISIGLLLMGFVTVVLFAPRYFVFGLVALVSIIVFIEAGARKQLSSLIVSLTNGLAIVCSLLLISAFFWQIVVLAVFTAGAYILRQNLRELRY
ncbi:MAG: hypothetical protein H0T73_08560 [Ardenticatenales bacterium]|nr:hypothetical protein [Ardenticatenales bacterium]